MTECYRLTVRVSTKSCQMFFDLLSSSLHFPVRTSPTSLQASSRKEFDVNWEGVSTAHDGVNWTPFTGSLARLLTKHNMLQDSAQELIYRNQNLPYPGFSRSEFHVLCLRIRLDSKVCFPVIMSVTSLSLGPFIQLTINYQERMKENEVVVGKEVGNKTTFERERALFAFTLPIDTH
jgi:hypothetical protein